MASYYSKVRLATEQPVVPPIAEKLQGIFESLEDAELIKALQGRRCRGYQGYMVIALWRSYLISYILNMGSVRELIRNLENNPVLCELSGISPWAIPHESTYSRFVAKLTDHQGLVKGILDKAVGALEANLEDFGKIIAIDSTDVRAYSKGVKNSDTKRAADPDATWGAKKKHGGQYFWFGYKAHMVSDAVYELPIHVDVTTASRSDFQSFIPPLRKANVRPDYVLADAGYDALYNYEFTLDELNAIPVIDLNKRGKKNTTRIPKRSKQELRLLGKRNNPGIARDSAEWKRLYSKRVSVERLFSRMKECRRLTKLRHRGIEKVTLHVYLSTLTIAASAVSAMNSEKPLRKVA